MITKKCYSDFLVIGTGIAGLSFAIKASEFGTVHVVTKKKDTDSNTNYAQGGIASVLSADDSFEMHVQDTLKAGAGLCYEKAVRILVEDGPLRIKELMDWGTRFTLKKDNEGKEIFDLGREGGHSKNRIAHANDLTGREIETALLKKISTISNIKLFENHTAIDLLTEHQLKKGYQAKSDKPVTCYGAYILENETGYVHVFNSQITLLASGGVGQVYLHTTNPDIATGDGIAMAFMAGAYIADMEFLQFHPTTLYTEKPELRSFLISEAVRGEGAILLNTRGQRFMEHEHPLKDLAPRDIVARAIDRELKKYGDKHVYLDISFKGKEFLQNRFPNIFQHCFEMGIDISKEPIPVVPAAHYMCGGIVTDLNARSSIRNLYVAGECACTGIHGANRLASNSLLEAVVFSHRALKHAVSIFKKDYSIPEFPSWSKEGTFDLEEWILIQHNLEEIKRIMWDYVGIVRSNLRLQRAYRRILLLDEEIRNYYRRGTISSRLIELRNLSIIAKLIIKSSMNRNESRGLNYNTDFPDAWEDQRKSIIQKTNTEPFTSLIEDVAMTFS